MPLDTKDEYGALRTEMLTRYSRIVENIRLVAPGVLGVLAFQHANPNIIPVDWILAFMEGLILVVGLVALNEFRHIYRLGTYIALFCEHVTVPGWHRMSRTIRKFLDSDYCERVSPDLPARKRRNWPFPFGERWGEDSTMIAYILFLLVAVSWISCAYVAGWKIILSNLLVDILGVLLVVLICELIWGMGRYRKDTESVWLIYKEAWRTSFQDPYELKVRTSSSES